MAGKDARGFCPECLRFMRVKADGTLRHHGGPRGTGSAGRSSDRAYRCPGAGTVPPARLTGHGLISGRDHTGTFVSTWVSGVAGGTAVATLLDDGGVQRVVYAASVCVAGES